MRNARPWQPALLGALLIGLAARAPAQNPGPTWQRFASPEQAGWSAPLLEQAFRASGAAAMMVIQDGKVVAAFGATSRRYKCHSVRKSLLSALYGIHAEAGTIAVDSSLRDLQIDDRIPLTGEELGARIVDLLRSASGVYLPAAAETATMTAGRPPRGSHPPGSFRYYNNWDFNVLGTIFERQTGRDLFVEFQERIAAPLQMEDFRLLDGAHDYSESMVSIHPSYPFKMSARDLARFGQLYLQRGRWDARQVIPESWVAESTRRHFEVTDEGPGYTGYGYLWWLDETSDRPRSFFASGYGGQYVGVFPGERVVIVLLADTYRGQSIRNRTETIRAILLAKNQAQAEFPEFVPLEAPAVGYRRSVERSLADRVAGGYLGDYGDVFGVLPRSLADYQDHAFFVMVRGDGLVLERFDDFYRYRLLPISDTAFFVEDLDLYLFVDAADEAGKALPVFCADLRDMDLFHSIARDAVTAGRRYLASPQAKPASLFDLKLLAWNFKRQGRLGEATELLRLNVVQFPQSVDAHRELINTMRQSRSSLAETARAYSGLADELLRRGQDPRLARWFYQWLEARARPTHMSEREAAACAGTYGDRRFVAERGNLYLLRGGGANAVKYRLQKVAGRLFVIDDDFLDGVRFEFAFTSETGAATLTVLTIDGSRTETARR